MTGPVRILPCKSRTGACGFPNATAAGLHRRGINIEIYHQADKLKNQLRYATRKAIPFVWFPPFDDACAHEVKDMTTGGQSAADPDSWILTTPVIRTDEAV